MSAIQLSPAWPVRPSARLRWLAALIALLSLSSLLGCEELLRHKKRKFGSTCGNSTECESGVCSHGTCTQSCGADSDCGGDLCIESTCQQADSDYDGDGLLNKREVTIGTSPAKKDSDGDGIDDGTEVGQNVDLPVDTNGNGIPDALESNILDKDQDCIVDAFDKVPNGPDPLPGADGICNQGVCAGAIGKAKVTCVPSAQGTSTVGLPSGCTGCVCEAPGLADWQGLETFCDGLDNDCDGQTDENQTWNQFPLGSPCHADKGICAVSAAGVLQPPGKVECGTDKTATCSTLGNGHESLAGVETCNSLDDDCDGQTDEDFLWQQHHVGDSCADTCGGTPLFCDDKKATIGGAVVRCLNETTAMCAGKPWASGFVGMGQGAPQPRTDWTAGLVGPDRVLLFSGKTPAAGGMVLRDESWTLDVAGLKQGLSVSQPWHHELTPGPLPIAHAALVWDEATNRSLLLGGYAYDVWKPTVWSIAPAGEVTEVSALPFGDPLAIPELWGFSNTFNEADQRPSLAAIVKDGSGNRGVVVVATALPSPIALPLSATPVAQWQAAPLLVGGVPGSATINDPICLTATPDGSAAVLVEADGTTWWITHNGETPMLHQIGQQGEISQVPRTAAQCAIDNTNTLHLIGGVKSDGTLAKYLTADLTGIANNTTPTEPNDIFWSNTANTPAVLERAGGFAAWHGASQTIVIGGGWSAGVHRVGRSDVWAFAPGTGTATRLDTQVPAGRIGAAQAWRPSSAQWCIAGGLSFDLPDSPFSPVRAVPVTDAWCVSGNGAWTQVGTGIHYAFGMAGIDQKADRFVFAGGFDLQDGEAVPDLQRLWIGQLATFDNAMEAEWVPTQAVRTLDLQTQALQTLPSSDAYRLSASSVAMDPLRNRLIISGGFDEKRETHAFLTLDLATLAWTNVGANVPPLGACGGECHPTDRYGAPMIYDPVHDILSVTAGSIRAMDGNLGQDTGVNGYDGCQGFKGNTLWLGTTGVFTAKPSFIPSYVPNFTDDTLTKPLLQQYFGGPSFVPVLFDWLGGRAWIAVPKRAIPQWGGPGGAMCNGYSEQEWTEASAQVSMAVGLCQPFNPQSVQAKLEPQTIQAPSALIHSAAYFHVPTQQAWLFGGLEPDGSVASGLWQLAETCVK